MTTKIITITVLVISCLQLTGQQIHSLPYRHAVTQAVEEGQMRAHKSTWDSIKFEGVFLEDFASYHDEIFPRSDVWEDKDAYINSTFADSMISLGVATLDAYDMYGYPYYSSTKRRTSADTLTSRPFSFADNLPDTNLYFSFFYQPGGKGGMPDSVSSPNYPPGDVLLVEFYNVDDTAWVAADTILDLSSPHRFKQAVYRVPNEYIKNGFRFRFRNFVSLKKIDEGTDLGQFGNEDMWHIDYIQLRSTSDITDLTEIKDIAITRPLPPSINEYTAVPWHHYTMAIPNIYRSDYPFYVKNYFADGSSPFRFQRFYLSYNLNADDSPLAEKTREYLIEPDQELYLEDPFNTGFYEDNEDMGQLKIVAYIDPVSADIVQPLVNDTAIRYETYYDYYAYDDGTAELGYGIVGEPEDFRRIAIKFRAFRNSSNPDSLRAVLIYFAKSIDSVSNNAEYQISIRKPDSRGLPANEILTTSAILTPDYSLGINQFARVELDPPVAISDSFFVVIEQFDGSLSIGYDINNNNKDKIYSYTYQQWSNPYSDQNGSLMVRPSFGNESYLPHITLTETAGIAFHVFPNPARDRLQFSLSESVWETLHVQVYDLTGQLLFQDFAAENSIPIGQLNPGMYFLVVTKTDGTARYTSKFIKE